ncbi:MAG TPA: hypothetical protein VF477_13815 [Mycobacterium sp.]
MLPSGRENTEHGRIYRSCRAIAIGAVAGWVLGLVLVAARLFFGPDLDKAGLFPMIKAKP